MIHPLQDAVYDGLPSFRNEHPKLTIVDNPELRGSANQLSRIPRIHPNFVRRHRIFEKLEIRRDITLVQSILGRGKTSAIADWANHQRAAGSSIVWLTMEPGADLEASVETILPKLKEQAGNSEIPLVIIIDDAHFFNSRVIANSLLDMLLLLPNARLILGTSHELKIEIEALSRRFSVGKICGEDLLLDKEEIIEMSEAWSFRVSENEAKELLRATGGWLLLLKMVLNGSVANQGSVVGGTEWKETKRMVIGSIRTPGQYEIAQSIALLDSIDIHSVKALKSACLDHFPAWKTFEADEAIYSLQQYGLIVLDDETDRSTWVFPTLVRDYLRSSIEHQSPGISLQIHAILAEHYDAAHGHTHLSETLLHARLGQRWDVLCRWMANYGSWGIHRFADDAREAFSSVPKDIRRSQPGLALASAVSSETGSWGAYASAATASRNTLVSPAIQVITNEPDPKIAALNASILVENLRLSNQRMQALDLILWVQEYLLSPHGDEISDLIKATLQLQHSSLLVWAGKNEDSLLLAHHAFDSARGPQNAVLRCRAAGNLALLYGASSRIEEAEFWADHAESESRFLHPLEAEALDSLRVAQAMIAVEEIDCQTASDRLSQISQNDQTSEISHFAGIVRSEIALACGHGGRQVQIHHQDWRLRQGQRSKAASKALENVLISLLIADGQLNRASRRLDGFATDPLQAIVQRSYLLLCAGQFDRAWALAGKVSLDQHTPRSQVQLQLTIAMAALALDEAEAATAAYRCARQIAELNRCYFVLAKFPREHLLRLDKLSGCKWEMLDHPGLGGGYPDGAFLVELSEREVVVLRAVQDHETLASVAEHLFVSVNTVKKQAHSAYKKIGVNSKEEALVRGAELGLFEV